MGYDIDSFHHLVGELIMYCQCIEFDIKNIYAGMAKGDIDENFEKIANQPLGPVLIKLEKLDNSDGKPHLSAGDYDLLDEIRDIRNHWVHSTYIEFVYKRDRKKEDAFRTQYRRLQNDCERLGNLSDNIEKVRIDVLKKYGRIY